MTGDALRHPPSAKIAILRLIALQARHICGAPSIVIRYEQVGMKTIVFDAKCATIFEPPEQLNDGSLVSSPIGGLKYEAAGQHVRRDACPLRHGSRPSSLSPVNSMRRWLLLAVGVVCSIFVGCGEREAQPPRLPNIVIYLVDALRADHLSVYGYPKETSPRLAEFAADAIVYDRAFSTSSWTRPAVASLLTGLRPNRHGAVKRNRGIDGRATLIGERLEAAGYHAAAFSTNPNVHPAWGFGRGFAKFVDVKPADRSVRADEVNEVVFAHLDERLETDPGEPFFFYIHTRDPHAPYAPPAAYAEKWQPEGESKIQKIAAAYDGEIAFNDHHFGQLIDRLEQQGLYRDSLIIFTSDHGEELRDHGAVGHARTLFDEVVRVPLLIKLPVSEAGGTRSENVVSLLDIVPTILDLIGMSGDEGVEGVSLLDRAASGSDRPVFMTLDLTGYGVRNTADAVLFGDRKLIERSNPQQQVLLFDLGADPRERSDLLVRNPNAADDLLQLLDRYREPAGTGMRLWLVGAAGANETSCVGVLRTTGRFVDAEGFEFELEDQLSVQADGRALRFATVLEGTQGRRWRAADRDEIGFAIDPPDAELVVESLTFSKSSGQFFAGQKRRIVSEFPAVFAVDSEAMKVDNIAQMIEEPERDTAKINVYLGNLSHVEPGQVRIDAEMEARLEALGYAK